jgi:hypothetical protein
MSGLAQAVGQSESAPRLLAGTGSDQVHLLVVMTAERGLCGGFNSSIVQACAQADRQPAGRRQDGEDPDRRQEGPRAAEARLRGPVRGSRGPERREAPRLRQRRRISPRPDLDRFDAGEFDVATIFFNRFQSVISQVPTATQVIPALRGDRETTRRAHRRSTTTNRPKRASWPTFCRAGGDADLHRAAGKRRLRAGRADVRDGQRHPQRRRNDRPPDHRVQPLASGRHHQRADRNHLGRRSALGTGDTTHG